MKRNGYTLCLMFGGPPQLHPPGFDRQAGVGWNSRVSEESTGAT